MPLQVSSGMHFPLKQRAHLLSSYALVNLNPMAGQMTRSALPIVTEVSGDDSI
jgi:hypothetical protein